MALFGLNWEESKWPWQFCYIVLYFFASKIGVKLPPGIKVPWHWRGPGRSSATNYHFCQKNAFFGQKKAFFQRFHFIQKWSVTPNTIFECVKNDFLLYYQKLVFFTEFNLNITINPNFTQKYDEYMEWDGVHWKRSMYGTRNRWASLYYLENMQYYVG